MFFITFETVGKISDIISNCDQVADSNDHCCVSNLPYEGVGGGSGYQSQMRSGGFSVHLKAPEIGLQPQRGSKRAAGLWPPDMISEAGLLDMEEALGSEAYLEM